MRKEKDPDPEPDPDPHLWLMDPDPQHCLHSYTTPSHRMQLLSAGTHTYLDFDNLGVFLRRPAFGLVTGML